VVSEDCLFLNVWRPAVIKPGGELPVLVWIHGGGFLNGGSSDPLSDGSALARQGLVVVAMNYRLGRLGFFTHPALKTTDEDTSRNYGFLDQLAALQWVRRNIAAFGGDAQQVTIAGESAGGISVMQLLAWPAAHGLFQRAVVMSGGGRTYGVGPPTVARAEDAGLAFAKSMGITGNSANAVVALRALPAEKVNGDLSMEALITKPATYAGGPIPDGKVVTSPNMPGEALRSRTAAKVPVLIGTTGDDLPVLFPPRDNPLSFFGADAAAAKAVYFAGAATPLEAIKKIAVDITMHEPARFVARQMTAAGQPAWLYRFDYVAESLRLKGTSAARLAIAGDRLELFDATGMRLAVFAAGSRTVRALTIVRARGHVMAARQVSRQRRHDANARRPREIHDRIRRRWPANRAHRLQSGARDLEIKWLESAAVRSPCPDARQVSSRIAPRSDCEAVGQHSIVRGARRPSLSRVVADGGVYEFVPVEPTPK
jgi:Carboxylesterase family